MSGTNQPTPRRGGTTTAARSDEQVVEQPSMEHFHLARMLAESAERFAQRPATRVEGPDGQWVVQSYADFHQQVLRLAAHLVGEGVQVGDRVLLFSGNRPEWSLADFAVMAAGAIVVPVFANSTTEQVRHVITDSGATRGFVAGAREEALVREAVGDELPLVAFDACEGAVALSEVLAGDHAAHDAEVARRTAAGRGSDVATIVYTSGTTGLAKGVMLTHGGFGNQQMAIDDCWDFQPTESSLCFLPLAHALERDWTFHVFHRGCLNTYCTDPKQVGRLLARARPTMLVSVPMLFEKVMAGVYAQADSPVAARTLEWALRVGGQCQRAHRKGKQPSAYWRAQLPLADRLVLSRIREAVGGNKTLFVSGGAPLRREVEEFFSAAGILLGQGYGLTESGPMMTIYRTDRYKLGTVGFPIKGSEIRIGDGGELLLRGGSIMKGYWNDPEATAEVLDADGWLHTGDVGHVDLDGFVQVTDRLKDIIVTANGKNVAPQAVEAALLSDATFEQAVVIGDSRPCLVALLQPGRDGWRQIARTLALPDDPQALAGNPEVHALLRRRAAELTAHLAHHEQVRDVLVLHDRITMEAGMVTSTLKVRRKEVTRVFAREIDDLYSRIAAARAR